MKKKNIILLALSAFAVVGLGGAALLTMPKASAEVKAAEGQHYFLTGSMNDWATDDSGAEVVDGGEAVYIPFEAEQTFKFRLSGTWDNSLGDAALRGNARGYFVDASNSDTNIKCLKGGTYMVTIKDSLLYIDFVSINKTDVFFQLSGWTNCYAYAYDNTTEAGITHEPLGSFPGTLITDITEGVNYAPNYSAGGGLGRVSIPYKSLSKTKLIFSNGLGGDENKTKDLPLGMNYYYLQSTEATGGMGTKGSGAKVVFAWHDAIKEATGQSLCNVSVEKATECLNLLSTSEGPAFVRNTTFYTWSNKDKTSKTNFTGAEIEETLNAIKDGTLALTFSPNETSSTPLWIALGSLALGGAAFAFFYLRKKRAQ